MPIDNFFSLFNLPISFDVDMQLLTARYQVLQKTTHPDKYATSSERERRLAAQSTAQINEAFNTLKSPLLRAQYLLQLNGIDMQHSANLDNNFLIQQIELREALTQVNDLNQLNAQLAILEQHEQQLQTQLRQQLLAQDYTAAKLNVHKLQFFSKLRTEIADLEERLLFY
jgi:molecular chaperone HscB